ncbi:MAG TPA: ATP-binding protein, partial [Polyangia bacterium]|nr:ATP-binding protein [Polyangia bacterium]
MTTSGPHARDVFSGSSEMARRMREFDWSTTPLGAVASWPQSLRSAVSICIGSRFPIAIYWGPSLTLLYNDAWSPILGMKHPWALGQGAREVWPEIWTDIGPLFEQVMSTGESTYSEDALLPMYRHGYTEECYFNFTFTPVHGEGGRIEGVFNAVIETTFRVVSERRTRLLTRLGHRIAETRSAQAACVLAAEALVSATEDVPFCALYLVEPDGRSAKLAGQAGLPADRGLTENVRLGEDRQTWPLDRVQAGGGVLLVDDLERRLGFSAPGGKWPEPANAALIAPLVTGGQTAGFLILGVNPRRAVDEEYRQFAQQAALSIAAVVGNAIAFDAQRRRVEALAEIDRVKTAFFSNVSHEFRTPLTLMLGPQEDALASPGGTLSGEALRAVHRNTLRLLKLVNTLLDFSRIEAGRAQVSFQPTDLAGLTKDLASSFRSAVDRGGLTYQVDCPPLPEPVYVDRDMWEKIVLNLLSNAFKFTLEGEIRVSLRAEGDAVALRVADTGVGIPSDEVARVFERFHRIEGTRARTHEGSGIGLALVHDLVKLHGGRIEVASQEGKGTTFTVVLPRGRAHLPADRITPPATQPAPPGLGAEAFVQEALRWETAPSTPSLAPVPSPGHERILIADDNADMREYLVRLLRERWLVDEVSDGAQALEQVRRNPPDLILTDIMMPNLGGFGLLRELRADPLIASIPVIMLSARAGEEARVEGLQAGADDYLPKPFSARELIARVATHLQLARMRKVAEADRQRLYDLFEQAPVGIIVYEGPDLRISFQNATSRQIFNRPDARGKPFLEVFPRMADSPAYESLRRVWNGGPPESMPEMMFLVPKDGGEMEERYFTAHHQPLHDGSGAIVGVIAIGYDVSHERKLRREAQDANRAKDEFLAMLGHELRNPLSPM